MSILSSLNVSALGIHRNVERFNGAASEVARPQNAERVQPMVEMMIAEHGVQANINNIKAAARMSRAMLDIIA
jgi:flagellar basal body rod protein FlgC